MVTGETAFKRTDVTFPSGGETCAAWHYAPEDGDPAPCVVLAHGFGATREARLDAYAERFAAAGYHALVFDYRHFGASTGEPRQIVDVGRQLEDWQAGVAYARTLAGVDPERIAVWGSSFSGGHVLEVAAKDVRIAAVIAQVPHTSGPATLRSIPPLQNLKLTAAALRDAAEAALGRPPHYIGAVGPPGALAAITSPDAEPGFRALLPEGSDWRNEVAARVLLRVGTYSPGRAAKRLACPLLVQVAERDAITPPGPAKQAAHEAPRGELATYDVEHFAIYVGDGWERAVSDQLEFLERHLPVAAAGD